MDHHQQMHLVPLSVDIVNFGRGCVGTVTKVMLTLDYTFTFSLAHKRKTLLMCPTHDWVYSDAT